MKVIARDIQKLLSELSRKTKESIDHAGLHAMSEKIDHPQISGRYLYESLYDFCRKAINETDSKNLSDYHLNALSRFLGYYHYSDFLTSHQVEIDEVLLSLEGSYYSYVRKNSQQGFLLQSPVQIKREKQVMRWILLGPERSFTGELKLEEGCLFCLMENDEGKSFYHVYRIGRRQKPQVFKGTFAGVSTSFDPIGGRCVLIRQEEDFEQLVNASLEISSLLASEDIRLRNLGKYFQNYYDNNLKVNSPVGFDIGDLVE